MSIQGSHQKHIDNVVAMAGGLAPEFVGGQPDNIILKSWTRCANEYNLDPSRPRHARILPAHTLREHQQQIESFHRVARIGMDSLYKNIADLGYVILLTDGEGITIDYLGDKNCDKEYKAAGLYLGADWKESHSGTNGVGLCLNSLEPVVVHQADHFHATHIGLSCTAAPIFDPYGDLLSVLDLSALTSPSPKESQYLALNLISIYAKKIESANFLRHFSGEWLVRFDVTPEFVAVSTDNIIAFDGRGRILGATQSAVKSLQYSQGVKSLVGKQINDIFECQVEDLFRMVSSKTESDQMLMTASNCQLFFGSVTEPTHTEIIISAPKVKGDKFLPLDRLAENDGKMARMIARAKRLVDQGVNILVDGETGTGKEVMARALHESSDRCSKPFVAVNTAAIPESLIESELFGYMPGSFTGGRSKGMKGLIQQSDGGTLFLDEIGDMPLPLQSRLLRVIAEKEVLPIGADKPISIDLHVISASHRDLRVLIVEGGFREDLYYRLNGATLSLPALREREDKKYIIATILSEEGQKRKITAKFSEDALNRLLSYPWPGNCREVRNVVQFAIAVCDNGLILPGDLPDELQGEDVPSESLHSSLSETAPELKFEMPEEATRDFPPQAKFLLSKLREHKWNITTVSEDIGVCRSTIYRRMSKYDILPPNLQ